MKENSIEEARERLEKGIKDIWFSTTYSQEQEEKDLKILLSDYKRVLQENEKLKAKLLDTLEGQKIIKEETPQYIKENYILKEKVKDKIKELNSRIEIYRKYVEQGVETDVEWVDNVADRETVKVLQELIKEEEDN